MRTKVYICITLMLVLILVSLIDSTVRFDTHNKYLQARSSDLKIMTMTESDCITEWFEDQNGQLAYAADKHYAMVKKTINGNTVLEEYFDEDGKPVRQASGHYAILREYNEKGQEFQKTYLGTNGKKVMTNSGFAIITFTFDSNNRIETEKYRDAKGEPVCTRYLGYGRKFKYDEKNRKIMSICLDEKDEVRNTKEGYAITRRSYYEEGINRDRIKSDFYFDADGKPVALSNGQYGVLNEYDEFGRANKLTYLDLYGNPIVTLSGYTSVVRTFYNDDTVETEMYLDLNDNPVALSYGQYGVVNVDGKKIYLDSDGNTIFQLNNFLYNHPLSVVLIALLVVLISVFCGKKANAALMVIYIL